MMGPETSERKEEISSYFVFSLICGGVLGGLLIGSYLGGLRARHIYEPIHVRAQHLKEDKLPDLVIESKHKRVIYLQQTGGTYKSLQQIEKEQDESHQAQWERTKKSITDKAGKLP